MDLVIWFIGIFFGIYIVSHFKPFRWLAGTITKFLGGIAILAAVPGVGMLLDGYSEGFAFLFLAAIFAIFALLSAHRVKRYGSDGGPDNMMDAVDAGRRAGQQASDELAPF